MTDLTREGLVEQLTAERDFLLARSSHAGKCMFGGKRWTGVSSNALVAIAFGQEAESDSQPFDSADLAACYRTLIRLPDHLISEAVIAKLEDGEAFVAERNPGSVEAARVHSEWPGMDALRARAMEAGRG